MRAGRIAYVVALPNVSLPPGEAVLWTLTATLGDRTFSASSGECEDPDGDGTYACRDADDR